MKKQNTILIAVLTIFLLPSFALASWWNPFSWFKKKPVAPVEQTVIKEEKQNTISQDIKEPEKKNVTVPKKKTEPMKETKDNNQKIISPTITPPAKSETTLSILNVNVESTETSAYISWQTNIPAESKILLNGEVFFSKNNVSTLHYIEIKLGSGKSYTGTITALANNLWVNKEITFSTKQTPPPAPVPLQITIGNKNCTHNSCKVEWQTNYPSTSSITITKVGQTNVSWPFESENNGGTGHWKTLNNLNSDTQYFFTITSVSNSESAQTQGSFFTKIEEIPCKLPMACP